MKKHGQDGPPVTGAEVHGPRPRPADGARRPAAQHLTKRRRIREATFLIGGDTCTRRCASPRDTAMGKPGMVDVAEPRKVAESVRTSGCGTPR
ncbi:hypothetical protein QJS66_05130 [Kocuria rhizophila]|nr:hypothetical protein QJS66_05130 [Kocuria rhizophila]